MLYFAEVNTFEKELHNEIEKVLITDDLNNIKWTYPETQPKLITEAQRRGILKR